jgi:hypothetical protein
VIEKNKNTNAASMPEVSIVIMLAPDTTELATNSKIQLSPNEKIAEDKFRIGKVTFFMTRLINAITQV